MYSGNHQPEFGGVLDPRLYGTMNYPVPAEPGSAKVCGVCRDRAKSLHFGGMACDSCKAFFRRGVQNESYRHFRCGYEGHCRMDITTRKSCQKCRYDKCVQIGMEPSWVMTEDQREEQRKARDEKKRKKMEDERQRTVQEHRLKQHTPLPETRHMFLDDDDTSEIDNLITTFYTTYQEYPMPLPSKAPDTSGMIDIFISSVSRAVSYIFKLPHFKQLKSGDQQILIKHGVLAMVILRGAMVFKKDQTFSLKTDLKATESPTVAIDGIKTLVTEELYQNHQMFVQGIRSMNPDEKTLILLQMVVLYSSDRVGLKDATAVSKIQDHYTDLIRRYMNWYYGEDNTRLLYPKMLHRLADLRALTEAHTISTIRFPESDLNKVVDKFKEIDVNPYPAAPDFLDASRSRHRSEYGPRDRNGGQGGRKLPQRSNSLPMYYSEYQRQQQAAADYLVPKPGTPQAGQQIAATQQAAAGYPAPQPGTPQAGQQIAATQQAAAGYPVPQPATLQAGKQIAGSYGSAQFGSLQAGFFNRAHRQQWSQGYHAMTAVPDWAAERCCKQSPTSMLVNQSTMVAPQDSFQEFLQSMELQHAPTAGVDNLGPEEKRMKTEPSSPMMTQLHQHMTSPMGSPAPSYVSAAAVPQQMTTPFPQHGYAPNRANQFPEAASFHGVYPTPQ